MIVKHVEIGQHIDGPYKGLQFFKVTVDKDVNLDRATEMVSKIVGAVNLLLPALMKGKK